MGCVYECAHKHAFTWMLIKLGSWWKMLFLGYQREGEISSNWWIGRHLHGRRSELGIMCRGRSLTLGGHYGAWLKRESAAG